MSAPDSGYALMKRADVLERAYASSPVAKKTADVGRTLSFIQRYRYRGIGRYPLNADYPYVEPGWQWSERLTADLDAAARSRLRQIVGSDVGILAQDEWLIDGPWLIPDLKMAAELMQLLSAPREYELMEVARYPARTTRTPLGFDVGYWASGGFSLICDSMVWPIWHPPDVEALDHLARHAAILNENILFPTAQNAAAFRDFYELQEWSEKDGGFEIVEVAMVALV
jgi:hypothetical protein